jgi:hypothetical protein
VWFGVYWFLGAFFLVVVFSLIYIIPALFQNFTELPGWETFKVCLFFLVFPLVTGWLMFSTDAEEKEEKKEGDDESPI